MDALSHRAWKGVAAFVIALAGLVFLPAWTLRFWQAWAYWTLFSASVVAINAYFLRHDRALIERRLTAGPTAEHEPAQQRIQTIASALLCLMYLTAGIDHHIARSTPVDARITAAADLVLLAGFGLIFLTFRENSYASGVVEIGTDQRVVTTGPYGIVRHPMYSASILMFLVTPLALGSLWALLPALALSGAIAIRLLHEERYLDTHLPGYPAYRQTVRFRLLPGVW